MSPTRKFLYQMVSSKGVPSSKRIITLFAFMLMATGFISNLFFNLMIDEFIYDSMKWIVIGGLGFTASEQFARGGTTIGTKIGKDANKPNPNPYGYGGYGDQDDCDYEDPTRRPRRRRNDDDDMGDDQQGDGPPMEQIPN